MNPTLEADTGPSRWGRAVLLWAELRSSMLLAWGVFGSGKKGVHGCLESLENGYTFTGGSPTQLEPERSLEGSRALLPSLGTRMLAF